MQQKPLISLHNAGVERAKRWLVRNVSFDLHAGEIITLIGPNGSGKSTTIKLALGIIRADEGHVERRADIRIAHVPQKLAIDWTLPLTAERMVYLNGGIDEALFAEMAARVGVAELLESQVANLSGGEFQRLMLARAIARKPDLLVLDEPVQGVDFSGEVELYKLIAEARERLNCGILLVSHDLHVVMAATDKVICLNGHVCCEGTPQAVSQSSEYRDLFGVRGDNTLAVYQHQHDHTHLPDGRVRHADGSITDHCHPDDGGHNHHQRHKSPHSDRQIEGTKERSDAR